MALHPDPTEKQRAAVRHNFDPTLMPHTLPWGQDLHNDTDAMRHLAASSHPLIRFIRRSVARAPRPPTRPTTRLARDKDRAVRLFLTESRDSNGPHRMESDGPAMSHNRELSTTAHPALVRSLQGVFPPTTDGVDHDGVIERSGS
ncbi:hypothetical protein GCM10022295_81930 [Streptomyces osmaniensis]|uniref:Uncharacterized protein n=1 Tax=Streptomyces osmaniensis TaxID=593134 RepID=A0ABP6YPJ4_9ACTN